MSKGLKVFIKVIVCIAVLFLFIHFIGFPLLQNYVAAKECKKAYGPDFSKAKKLKEITDSDQTQCGGGTQCKTNRWVCINSKGEGIMLDTGQPIDLK